MQGVTKLEKVFAIYFWKMRQHLITKRDRQVTTTHDKHLLENISQTCW